ncbi:MAG TPA: lipid-A-disaccharide synthase [Coleofasciculaceae cyanobacterium]
MQAADILILSNGPGEVTTWVRPVVKALRQQLGNDRNILRISVVLSPCPNATGKEAAIAKSYPEVDRVQGADDFFPFLLRGKTAENWDWRDKGVVVFLGGDQFFPVVISRRLGYRTVVYAEWDARWHSWIDRFGVMNAKIIADTPKKYAHKLTVVGDLMADVGSDGEMGNQNFSEEGNRENNPQSKIQNRSTERLRPELVEGSRRSPKSKIELIGLLPGSKPAKLAQGVPLALAIAQHLHQARPQTRFVIPVAPTLDLSTLARFADRRQNPIIEQLGWAEATLVMPVDDTHDSAFLKTPSGLCIELWNSFPAYELLSQCRLCLTTVGANTAELGSLSVPMIVLLPTQQLDAMRSWDGLPGLLARLPGVGSGLAKAVNWLALNWLVRRKGHLFAWPNKWAQAEIVPELAGALQPEEIAQLALDYLEHPEKLEQMRSQLRLVRGQPGAAQKLAQLVCEELHQS